jgi:bacteriocin-like protein
MKELGKKELQKIDGGFLFAVWLAFSIGYLIGDLLSDRELFD